MRLAILSLLLSFTACASPPREPEVPLHYAIGVVHRPVTTASEPAQLWFDRGLALAYGFNHEAALRCFDRAAELDPGCAMAWWGRAWALGPNYNAPGMEAATLAEARLALGRAQAELDAEQPVERALVEALARRYGAGDWDPAFDRAYAESMTAVAAAFPDDADVAALCAEALMQLRPWGLWSPEGEPAPELAAIRATLEPALERWPDHPALCHLYIHAMEAGPEVAAALPAARRLEDLTPGLGHLIHMPSHIYTWTGHYDDVVRVNLRAVEVDDAYADFAGRQNIYTAYRIHNYHFVAYGAMWSGQRALGLEYAKRLAGEIPRELMAAMPDLFEVFSATPYHVMVRFGMWSELLEEPDPGPELPATRAVWRYARGVALASLGRVDEALAERDAFLAARADVPPTRMLFQNPVAKVLDVAELVLGGEIDYRRGDYGRAFEQLRAAVALDERMNYDEPWGWMEPARHALGALLTEQGQFAEAEAVYRANLDRYPENGWALHGLAECLRGLGRPAEAEAVAARFERAWASSDVEIPGSCFCRTVLPGAN